MAHRRAPADTSPSSGEFEGCITRGVPCMASGHPSARVEAQAPFPFSPPEGDREHHSSIAPRQSSSSPLTWGRVCIPLHFLFDFDIDKSNLVLEQHLVPRGTGGHRIHDHWHLVLCFFRRVPPFVLLTGLASPARRVAGVSSRTIDQGVGVATVVPRNSRFALLLFVAWRRMMEFAPIALRALTPGK